MQSLGDHLGAHQDVDFADPKVGEDAPIVLLPLQGIRIHAFDPCVREPLAQGSMLINDGKPEIDYRGRLEGLKDLLDRNLTISKTF
jgi:alkylated DNA repair dioxygenase AlkB